MCVHVYTTGEKFGDIFSCNSTLLFYSILFYSVDLQKKACFAFCLQHSAKSDALLSPLPGESGKIYVCETSKVFHFSLESSLPY